MAQLPQSIVMFDQTKPDCSKYILHSLQGPSFDEEDLMKFLNFVNDPQCFISSGIRFHIQVPDI